MSLKNNGEIDHVSDVLKGMISHDIGTNREYANDSHYDELLTSISDLREDMLIILKSVSDLNTHMITLNGSVKDLHKRYGFAEERLCDIEKSHNTEIYDYTPIINNECLKIQTDLDNKIALIKQDIEKHIETVLPNIKKVDEPRNIQIKLKKNSQINTIKNNNNNVHTNALKSRKNISANTRTVTF
jgi:hypothetical protein